MHGSHIGKEADEKISSAFAAQIRREFEQQEYQVFLEQVPPAPEKPSNLLIFGDGEYLLRENCIGRFLRRISDKEFPSLKDGPEEQFEMFLPSIPKQILSQQISFYREVMVRHSNAEAYTLILWDKEGEKYIVTCPEQEVAGATVVYHLDMEKYPSSRYVQVVSCHSHDTMGAFFSGVDDADEKADMLYMVLGQLDKPTPEFKIRANLKGKEICKLELDFLFDITDEDFSKEAPSWRGSDFFPTDWLENVVPLKRPIHTISSRFGFPNRPRFNRAGFQTQWPSQAVASAHQQSFPFASGAELHAEEERQAELLRFASSRFSSDLEQKMHPEDALEEFLVFLMSNGFSDLIELSVDEFLSHPEPNPSALPGNENTDFAASLEQAATWNEEGPGPMHEVSDDPWVVNAHLDELRKAEAQYRLRNERADPFSIVDFLGSKKGRHK